MSTVFWDVYRNDELLAVVPFTEGDDEQSVRHALTARGGYGPEISVERSDRERVSADDLGEKIAELEVRVADLTKVLEKMATMLEEAENVLCSVGVCAEHTKDIVDYSGCVICRINELESLLQA